MVFQTLDELVEKGPALFNKDHDIARCHGSEAFFGWDRKTPVKAGLQFQRDPFGETIAATILAFDVKGVVPSVGFRCFFTGNSLRPKLHRACVLCAIRDMRGRKGIFAFKRGVDFVRLRYGGCVAKGCTGPNRIHGIEDGLA